MSYEFLYVVHAISPFIIAAAVGIYIVKRELQKLNAREKALIARFRDVYGDDSVDITLHSMGRKWWM